VRWPARLAALALALLLVAGGVLWVHVMNRYVEASRVQVEMPRNVGYADVVVPPITSADAPVTVGVLFWVRNPSGIAIEVLTISYQFYMDNLTDTRPFVDKDDTLFIAVGGYFAGEEGQIVPPHGEVFVWGNMTIRPTLQPDALDRLNHTFNGLYFPIINAGLIYRIPGTEIVDTVVGIWFVTQTGVPPREA
jgi:hypothetical protein